VSSIGKFFSRASSPMVRVKPEMANHESHTMKQFSANVLRPTSKPRHGEQAGARIVILVLVFFLLGIGTGAFLIYRSANSGTAKSGGETSNVNLSESTKAVLKGLDSPVEIRFYSLLDPASVSDTTRAFAKRVEQLLSEYQTEAGGKINVAQINSMSAANADAASADGIRPFNMDKGDACYLGIAISKNGQKETFPRLDPDWEQALQFDLARAIVRVSSTAPKSTTVTAAAATAQPDKTVVDEVKRAIPNLPTISLEEGTQILREASTKEFSAAVAEMEKKVTAARDRVVQAQSKGSQAEQQAAMKEYEQVQAEQTDKLKQIAARAQEQIQTLERLKKQ